MQPDPDQVHPGVDRFGLDDRSVEELKEKAITAKARAYCPYSHFRVGAAILSQDGSVIVGANVENASYPVGTCAERCAVGTAVTQGHLSFKAIAVATDISPPASPCGMCRQFLREFCPLSTPIFMYDKSGACVLKTLEQLLPMSFGPEDLKGGG
ncbi:cytidine deaminase [Usnea florida]